MPNQEFLEKYPLYRKFEMLLPTRTAELEAPAIHMYCPICGSEQTYNITEKYHAGGLVWDQPPRGVTRIVYQCASCNEFKRFFLLKFDSGQNYVMKVGQEPPWDISLDPALEKMLSDHADYYRKGLICESQSYGIGAFVYYRRVVEEIIDELLDEIGNLVAGEERERYLEALETVKKTTVTQNKIALVKDLLPLILRPDGMNPLAVLHSTLSEGLHGQSDERCIELAETVREILVFLVNQVAVTRDASKSFTESIRKLLDRRRE